MEGPDLKKAVKERDWKEMSRILKDHPDLAEDDLSEDEFDVLWESAPLDAIQALLKVFPEAYEMEDGNERDLIETKMNAKQWDFLDKIFQEFPQVPEMHHARAAAKCGASLDYLEKHWNEIGRLLHSIHSKDWVKCEETLKDNLQLDEDHLSYDEFDILWKDAPFEIIRSLLEAIPEAYEMNNGNGLDLVAVKVYEQEWEFLKSFIHEYPNMIVADNVKYASRKDAPKDIFELMLDQQPNAPLEDPDIMFKLIEENKLVYFCIVLDRCPAATELEDDYLHLTPLLLLFQKKEKMNSDWIGPILKANPKAAKQKDFDGKTPLHLAYQHGVSAELIDMMLHACPDAENIRDNLGRLPRDLANRSREGVFTPVNDTNILIIAGVVNHGEDINTKKESYPDNAVVVCRGDMLIRDIEIAQNREDKVLNRHYSKQVLARDNIFANLLDEFSKMVGVDDKDVIQKAAATQALAVQYLSNQDDTIIDFNSFGTPGYWYQQEVLKLVMRVYHETRLNLEDTDPAILDDAFVCTEDLERRKNDEPSPKPSDEHFKAYSDLTAWLTEGLDKSPYSVQGPVLKPLQSLFNKLFIRRGQTSVHVIGDMVRGTLLVDDVESLQAIVTRINNTFPNITKNQFRQPDSFNRMTGFLTYVHDDLNLLPDNDNVLPYRFKANSSQKKKDTPLWYNLNFFLHVPEYHRVGVSEMFVACELQIGLTEEVNKHRQTHVAYERDRILSNQPLLKNYDSMTKMEEGEDREKFSKMSNCTEEDDKLIKKILFGKIASEVLIPCTTSSAGGNDNNNGMLLFENGPFSLSKDEIQAGSYVKPERRCLNNRSLNWFASNSPKENDDGYICMAVQAAAGPYKLDSTKRYFVESFVFKDKKFTDFWGTVGLYAHVGPYSIQLACESVSHNQSEDIIVVESDRNLSYLEHMCPVPIGSTALEVILYGLGESTLFERIQYGTMNLSLKVFDVY